MDTIPTFHPHRLFRGPHLQTYLGYRLKTRVARSRSHNGTRQHILTASDGERLSIFDDEPKDWSEDSPIVIMVPGMGGTHRSPYMVRISARLNAMGYRTFRLDQRGYGAGRELTDSLAHGGRSDDVRTAIEASRNLSPQSPVVLVGFSLGANMALRACAEGNSTLDGIVEHCIAIAPPIDVERCVRTSHPRYTRWLAKHLWKANRGRAGVRAAIDRLNVPKPKSVFEFDRFVTAPLCGFESVEEFYAASSCDTLLQDITVPTWIIASEDDPVIHANIFVDISLHGNTQLYVADAGGHVGFLSDGRNDPDMRWLDWRIADVCRSVDIGDVRWTTKASRTQGRA